MRSPWIRSWLCVVPMAAMIHLQSPADAHAEIPKASKEDLHASASHVIHGTVSRTYERKEKQREFEFTYGVAEVAVGRVAKGADMAANDIVFVRYWGKRWIGPGNPPPDHYGHCDVPEAADTVEVYVRGDRKTGFDVLSPNGFFAVSKATVTPGASKRD